MYESPFSSSDSSTVLRAGWRYRRAVVAAIVVGFALGLVVGLLGDTSVTASTNLVLRDAATVDRSIPGRDQSGAHERYVRAQALFAMSDEVLGRVEADTGIPVEDLRSQLDVTARSSGESMKFSATADDEAQARALLDVHIRSYAEARRDWIDSDTELARQVIEDATAGLSPEAADTLDVLDVELRIEAEIYGTGVAFADRVEITESSSLIGLAVPALAGAMVFAAIALVVAAIVDGRSPLVLGSHSLVGRLGLPVRGVVPPNGDDDPLAFERLAAEIESDLRSDDGPSTSVAVLAVGVGAGARGDDASPVSEMCRHLADSGHRICLLDGASDRDRNAEVVAPGEFSVDATNEMEFYRSPVGGELILVQSSSGRRSLPDSARDASFGRYMRTTRSRFDFVVFDCQSLDRSSGALKLAPHCDEAILFVPVGTRLADVDRTVYALRQAGVAVRGYVTIEDAGRSGADYWWSR